MFRQSLGTEVTSTVEVLAYLTPLKLFLKRQYLSKAENPQKTTYNPFSNDAFQK
jgi:hypothetical protein